MAIGKKTGGRKKGTPNKLTSVARGMIKTWLNAHNSPAGEDGETLLMRDFNELDARERVRVSAEFVRIVMPHNLNIDKEDEDEDCDMTMERRLAMLAGETEENEKEDNYGDDTDCDEDESL